jgi:hypothetical protein
MTCGTGFVVNVFRKFCVAFNSSSNSLFLYFCSKTQISFDVGAHVTSSST